MKSNRRGFTMIELLVVVVLGGLVIMAALQILVTNQRTYTAQNAVIQGQQNNRMALEVLLNELREVSPSGGDILSMASNGIRVRLMRKFSRVCEMDYTFPTGQPTSVVLNLQGRHFEAGDSVFVFADNDEKDDDDDVWIAARVTSVDTTVTCPQNGEPATELTYNGQGALFIADSVGVGAPVRSYGTYTFGVTGFLGDSYLARREGSGPVTPIVGPIRTGNGLEFTYRDSLGAVTSTPTDVRQIEVTIRTGSGVLNSLNQEVRDSINAWIYTRN